jgi:hypothetical protein
MVRDSSLNHLNTSFTLLKLLPTDNVVALLKNIRVEGGTYFNWEIALFWIWMFMPGGTMTYPSSKGGNTSFAEKPELISLKITSFLSDLLFKKLRI